MDSYILDAYRALKEAQVAIAHAQTLDEALREGLKVITRSCNAELGTIWYAGGVGTLRLRPYFWIGASDLTSCSHLPGEGMVGRVFASQAGERYLSYQSGDDPSSEADYADVTLRSVICVPFSSSTRELGCIQLVNKVDGGHFAQEEADVCEMMAMLAGMALDDNENLAPAWEPGKTIMRVRGVTRDYRNGETVAQVLKGVNLDVYGGEFLVLLGESGCGKSTLLNIIGGMDRPTSGTFECYGADFTHASVDELCAFRRDRAGFIFQSYNLMPNLTAHQNLALIGTLVKDPMTPEEALSIVGLANRGDHYPSQLSGGQQQRVSIARALMKRPRLILADEPTAALDYETSIEILQVMEHIVSDEGTTMIMVTHNEEICRMADRVVRLRDGRVSEVTVNRHKARAKELVW